MSVTNNIHTLRKGIVTRVVNDCVAYVHDPKSKTTFSFTPMAISEFQGESFEELNILAGQTIEFSSADGTKVTAVIRPPGRRLISENPPVNNEPLGAPDGHDDNEITQFELHPSDPTQGRIRCDRAIPKETRHFNKLMNTRELRAGDLLLSRTDDEKQKDPIGQQIMQVQLEGGYARDDARWTHAALYLGDHKHVVEATVGKGPANIRITSLDDYCQGTDILRFRRPKALIDDRETAWVFCIRALSRLREKYDFTEAARIWFEVILHHRGFWDSQFRSGVTKAVMCSTFYSDAFNEATGRRLSEVNGICVPAWLSVSSQFDDVRTHWQRIV